LSVKDDDLEKLPVAHLFEPPLGRRCAYRGDPMRRLSGTPGWTFDR
jgi:hypothetical protein